MNLNLHQLEAFVRVARLGGFSRAADQMHLSQAGLSILVRKLEQRIAAPLFERTTRSVVLTDAGRGLLPIAERMLQDAESILRGSRGTGPAGHMRIVLALPPLLAVAVLPGVLAEFRIDHPGVTVVFRECVRDEQLSRLYTRDVDFALGFGLTGNAELDCTALSRDYLCAAHPADHALSRRAKLRWVDLVGHPIVVNAPGSDARVMAETTFLGMGQNLAPAYETSHHVTAVQLAATGLGVAIVSSSMRRLAPTMNVRLRLLRQPLLERTLQVLKRRGHTLSPEARDFLRLFGAAVDQDAVAMRKGDADPAVIVHQESKASTARESGVLRPNRRKFPAA